ncbi:MAG: cellulose biosynthesis cyclic di-GMP-binding regulatory protein BcsB [Rhodanobacter sp.]
MNKKPPRRYSKLQSTLGAALCVAAMGCFTPAVGVHAAEPLPGKLGQAQVVTATPADALVPDGQSAPTSAFSDATPVPGARTYSLSLRQLGAWSAPKLSGVEQNQYFSFGLRPDEVVTRATLMLGYDYSPALLPNMSHLVVGLNGSNAAMIALPQDRPLDNRTEVPIDPRLFKQQNELLLRFIGHYTLQCEDPFNSSLWLTVHNATRLVLTVAPRGTSSIDLSRVQDLFVRADSPDVQEVPVVFAPSASFQTYKTAGIVASWLASESHARNVRFKAYVGQILATNAIVFLRSGDSIAGLQGSQNASLSIVPNPANPDARLLLVSGADDAAIERAARGLALAQRSLTGMQTVITRDVAAKSRKPYDAPAWLPLDRPVRFGEIAKRAELNVKGYAPGVIRLNYRVPPDLFTARSNGAPVHLRYLATALPNQWSSTLNIAQNGQQLATIAIDRGEQTSVDLATPAEARSAAKTSATRTLDERAGSPWTATSFNLPSYVNAGRNQLQMQFNFEILHRNVCQTVPPDNMVGSIDSNSTIDFSSFPHYEAMPNLASFASLGFPFTRLADLSQTAVVLSEHPDTPELGLYLSVMGLMGESTGYPVLNDEVVAASSVDKVADRDLLVLGVANGQPLLSRWADELPITTVDGERKLRETVRSWRPVYRWDQHDIDSVTTPAASINLAAAGDLSVIMGLQSPLKSGRSVVFLYADKAAGLDRISHALTDPDRWQGIHGDFALVHDTYIETAKVGPTYYVGSLPLTSKLLWFLKDQSLLVGLAGLLGVLLLAVLVFRLLRRRKRV